MRLDALEVQSHEVGLRGINTVSTCPDVLALENGGRIWIQSARFGPESLMTPVLLLELLCGPTNTGRYFLQNERLELGLCIRHIA